MLCALLTTATNVGWRGDILKTPFQCFTSEKDKPCIGILSLVFAVGVFHLLQDVRLSP